MDHGQRTATTTFDDDSRNCANFSLSLSCSRLDFVPSLVFSLVQFGSVRLTRLDPFHPTTRVDDSTEFDHSNESTKQGQPTTVVFVCPLSLSLSLSLSLPRSLQQQQQQQFSCCCCWLGATGCWRIPACLTRHHH